MAINVGEFFTKGYWKKFGTSDFWFGLERLRISNLDYSFLVLASAAVIGGAWLLVFAKKATNPHARNIRTRYGKLLVTMGFIFGLWFFFRWQNIPNLGTHFVATLILVTGLVWLGFVLKYHKKYYGQQVAAWEKEQMKMKYLNLKSR